jgi:hypothetical protein
VILALTEIQPGKRPSAAELMNHPVVSSWILVQQVQTPRPSHEDIKVIEVLNDNGRDCAN